MSLVEQALKKLQNAAPAGAAKGHKVPAFQGKPTVRSPVGLNDPAARSAEPGTAVPVVPRRVVTVDRAELRRVGVLPPMERERQLADEYRQIKLPVVAKVLGRGTEPLPNAHLIMVASALPGDGKTFTSINLAMSLALDKDLSVVLVDADVAKPHISKLFGVEKELGLLDALRDEKLDIESLILPTDVAGLSILPAGHRSETATELLASSRMEQIVSQLGSRDSQRLIVFDSPPLLLMTEARVLADFVGQILLVVRASVTPQQAVFDALERLGEGKPVSMVLNQSEDEPRADYYGHYGDENPTAGK